MDKNLLETFWVLAEGSDDKRVSAASDLIAIIKSKQSESEKPCKELKYTVDRLIKGLASSRKWARLGFATALAQVLHQFPLFETSSMVEKIKEHLKLTPTSSKSEKSNLLLGRIMAYLALIQADTTLTADDDAVKLITEDVLHIREEKGPLHQIATEVLIRLVSQVGEEVFQDQMWPLLKDQLTCGWDRCTPDILWLLLTVRKHHRKQFDNEFMTSHWKTKQVFNEKNYEALARVIKNSTTDHPIVHPICIELLQRAAKKKDHFTALWTHILYDKVFPDGINCVYLVFQLIPEALKLTSTPDQVYAILTPKLMKFVMKNITNKQCALHSAAKQLNQILISTCRTLAPGLQVAIVMSLVTSFGKAFHEGGMVTRATQPVLSCLSVDATKELGEVLMNNIRGILLRRPDSTEENLNGVDIVTQQKWSVLTLSNLINQETVSTDLTWCTSVAKFLFCLAFFGVENAGTSKLRQPLDLEVRQKMNSSFFKTLDKISKHLGKRLKGYHAYTSCLYDIVQCAQSLLVDSSEVVPSDVLDEKPLESWKKIITVTSKIKKKLERTTADVNDQLAFQLLFLHHGLQLFTEPSSAIEVLSELHTCYEKATKKRRQSAIRQTDDEPEWVDVIIDLLLSLLSQQSHLVRTVVNTVFIMVCPHLTRHSVQLILDIFKTSKEGDKENDLLQFEDSENEAENGGEMEEAESDDSTDTDTDTELSDEEGSDRDAVDENFINSVKAALGNGAAGTSDDESEEELDDSAMFRLDDALAAAFKGMSKNKKEETDKKTLLKHYKMRCLDILEVIVNHCSSSAVLLELIIPLLSLMDAGIRNAADKDLGDRANKVFSQLMHLKKLPPDPSLDRSELPVMVENLLEYSAKVTGVPMIQNTAAACAFVIKIISSVEKYTGPSPIKTRAMAATKKEKNTARDVENLEKVLFIIEKALKEFCLRRDSQVNHYFFLTVLEREPKLFWPLAETIFDQAVNDNVRIFCRTQMTAMLTVLISKSSVEVLEPSVWTEFASRIVTEVFQLIENAAKRVLKPRYLHELLVLLHKIFTVLDRSSLECLVTENMLYVINELKGSVSSDTRHIINKICGYCNSRRSAKKKATEKQRGISSEKNPLTDLQNGPSENRDDDVQMASNDTTDTTSQKTETPKKNKSKEKSGKKRHKSETSVGTEPDSDVMKEKKKKRKSLGITVQN